MYAVSAAMEVKRFGILDVFAKILLVKLATLPSTTPNNV